MHSDTKPSVRRWRIVAGVALLLGAAAVIAVMASNSDPRDEHPPRTVTLQLDWVHGGDFAGYYAAEQKGFYAGSGLSIAMLPGGPRLNPVAPVVAGDAEFGTSSAHNLIRARAEGKPVRAIACIYRRSPMVFASLVGSGIVHPRDFVDRTIRITKSAEPILDAVMANAGVRDRTYRLVTTRDTQRFASGEIEIWAGYITGAVRRIKNAGHRLAIVYPDDFGVHNYHQCLFTTDRMIAGSPALVDKFLRSSLEGWRFTIDHAAEVAAMASRHVADADLEDLIEYVGMTRALFNTGEDHLGWMKREVWTQMTENLRGSGVISTELQPDEVFTTRFLEKIYGTD